MDRPGLPPPPPDHGGADVGRIRAATRMCQPVFAWLPGVDKSAVAQWEREAKRPSGPALRLLEARSTRTSPKTRSFRCRAGRGRSLVHLGGTADANARGTQGTWIGRRRGRPAGDHGP